MKTKKTEKAKLENKRFLFFQVGLVTTLALVLAAFEWSSTPKGSTPIEISDYYIFDEEFIPPTNPQDLKPPPPVPRPTDIMNIIPNDEAISNEFLGENMEPEPFQEIDIESLLGPPEKIDDTPFIIVEDMPSFRDGGEMAFHRWVMEHLHYPEIAAENGISGTVILTFVIGYSGDVEDVRILRSIDPALDDEAVRVVSSSPKWTPGRQRGNPARVQYTIPIRFLLQ